jgi:hypothetical protein
VLNVIGVLLITLLTVLLVGPVLGAGDPQAGSTQPGTASVVDPA